MKIYKAIKELVIEMRDGDGFTEYGESDSEGYASTKEAVVPVGSIWEMDEDRKWRMCGGEFHLTAIAGEADDLGWIEIDKEILDEHFEEVEE